MGSANLLCDRSVARIGNNNIKPLYHMKTRSIMFTRSNFTYLAILALLFISLGDRFLPPPLSTASLQTRTAMNNLLVGAFPSWRPKTKPYERTEKAIDEIEKKQDPANR